MDRSWLTFDTLDNGASRVVSLAGLREGETGNRQDDWPHWALQVLLD